MKGVVVERSITADESHIGRGLAGNESGRLVYGVVYPQLKMKHFKYRMRRGKFSVVP